MMGAFPSAPFFEKAFAVAEAIDLFRVAVPAPRVTLEPSLDRAERGLEGNPRAVPGLGAGEVGGRQGPRPSLEPKELVLDSFAVGEERRIFQGVSSSRASTALRLGMPSTPGPSTAKEATHAAKRAASTTGRRSRSAMRNAAAKTSPAPVGSTSTAVKAGRSETW